MMVKVHCEQFPRCFEIGDNATVPICDKQDCPGRLRRERVQEFIRDLELPER